MFCVRSALAVLILFGVATTACSRPTEPIAATDPGDPQDVLSPDTGPALDWKLVDHPGFSLGFVVWSGSQFVTVNTRDDGLTELLTSPDGINWDDGGRTFEDIDVRDLAVSKDAVAVWGTVRETTPTAAATDVGTIDRIHFSPDNGATWHQRDIRPPGTTGDDSNPGSQIVTAAVRGNTVLVSAFFRTIDDTGAAVDDTSLLRLDLAATAAPDGGDRFAPVQLEPADIFIGDITVTASGIVMIGSDADRSLIYTEGPDGWLTVEPDTRIATLLSDGRQLYANAWDDYRLLRSTDLGATWRPLDTDIASFNQTFVGPSGVAGTTTITSTEPWAVPRTETNPPTVGTDPLDPGRTRSETYITWSADGSTWHHETTTSSLGFPAFTYLAIGDGVVLAVATPLLGEAYEEGATPSELYRAEAP